MHALETHAELKFLELRRARRHLAVPVQRAELGTHHCRIKKRDFREPIHRRQECLLNRTNRCKAESHRRVSCTLGRPRE